MIFAFLASFYISHASALMALAPEGVKIDGRTALSTTGQGRQFSSANGHGTGFFTEEKQPFFLDFLLK